MNTHHLNAAAPSSGFHGGSLSGVNEPPDGKVLRGSHDGFIEALVPNMALLRRRIGIPT